MKARRNKRHFSQTAVIYNHCGWRAKISLSSNHSISFQRKASVQVLFAF